MSDSNARKRTAQLVLLAAASLAAPTARALFVGGGLTILSQNLLDGAQNDGSAAILVHQPSQFSAASTSCTLLGETPWRPENSTFATALQPGLAYQAYQGLVPAGQQYWVGKAHENDDACRSIGASGNVTTTDCLTELPVLCTQSALVSNHSADDNSASWQVVQSVNGTLMTGYRDLHTWKFRGVRYANPPARFTYATKAVHNNSGGAVTALEAGADCVQPIGEVKKGSSEDCLFANVWTPHLPPMAGVKNASAELKPVMLYLYGGGFTSGSGKNPNTDGTNLASRGDTVVVSVNYRVGNTGFLAFDDGVHRGNYALSDMVAALEWVRDYIQYFGGDASRVTLFGESAGAQATHILLGSPKAAGLFHRAIMQSDPQGYPRDGRFSWMQYDTIDRAFQGRTTKVLKETGCLNATDAVACLSKFSGFDLANLTTNVNGAVMDGVYLTEPWLVVNKTGLAANISVMTGVNRDESGVLIDDYPANGTTFSAYFSTKVAKHFDLPHNASVATAFNLSTSFGTAETASPESIFNASMAIATDGEFTCFDLAKAYSGARHGAFAATYAYQFNRTYQTAGYTRRWCVPPATAARPHGDPDLEYYKCHAGEQMLVFGTAARGGLPDRDGHDVHFTQLIIDYWSSFARSADPNPPAAYLKVRGHQATLAQAQSTGRWDPVHVGTGAGNSTSGGPTLRLLQWNGAQVPFGNAKRCAALGVPLDALEKYTNA
ncbi:Carboxylesterase, type B [Niveomyces insectorum RCEF 264]|uniref:Carboxylesterase, type B n=1 Tax=Niveomyces insectorum RCEF 264 TaxID=1081102 RepID=A0A167WYB6_9HYPO|nr:Carboxylesterase, type B [Niveomyces insectorum RCEF 264]